MATATMIATSERVGLVAASTPGAHASVSGGVFTRHFVESLMQPTFSHPAALPESFATPFDIAPSPRELEDQIGITFELVVEQWDRVREQFATMDVSTVRERWLRSIFSALDFRWSYQRGDTVLGDDENLRFSLSHRGWPESGAPIIHTVAPSQDLDARVPGQRGIKGKSPHDMVQAYLNASPAERWAIVTNGRFLRILRTYHHVYSKGYVEFDLEGICESRASADWRALYRLAHASRFWTREGSDGAEGKCPLDRLYDDSIATGVKVGEQLQGNVRRAIQHLATGFLDATTIARLRGDEEATRAFYGEVLHVVYRLLFLLYAEQRGMLPGRTTLYAQEYSIARLRERVTRAFPTHDDHRDLWEGLKATFHMVATGVPALGIFGYNGELFSDTNTPTLNRLTCRNGALLQAIRELAFVERDHALQRINYTDVGVEEIGAVYESLLEYTPRVTTAPEVVEIEKKNETIPANSFYLDPRGTSRKTSGSYYTRPDLVAELITSALKPVLEDRLLRAGADPQAREAALLALRTVDPACGSGAFLIAATDYLGRELARIRTSDDYPADRDLRHARRDVLMHCIYGVDLNPMAVELAKVSLWISSAVEDLPLNFLDHHIKCGNSLIGATPQLLAQGVPDAAFEPVTGDDKAVSRDIKRRNAKERTQLVLPFASSAPLLGNLAADYKRLVEMPEDTPEQVHAKRATYERLAAQMGDEHSGRLFADAWCAAFFWPLDRDHLSDAPTYGEVRKLEQSPWSASIFLKEEVRRLAQEYRFFHWHLEFPDVFAGSDPGFDCVLGNPPWERIKVQEEEFFAPRAPHIANAMNAATRKRLIAQLPESNKPLAHAFRAALRNADAQGKFYRIGGRFPLAGVGDINTFAVFTELARSILRLEGRASVVVPVGIVTSDTTKHFFADLMGSATLHSIVGFENEAFIFPGVHNETKFCIVTITGRAGRTEQADFVFFCRYIEDTQRQERHFTLSQKDLALLSPNTGSCPTFRHRADYELNIRIYARLPVLLNERTGNNPWDVQFLSMFHMTNDSRLFHTREDLETRGFSLHDNVFLKEQLEYRPLYEAKMIGQYDHRFGSLVGRENAGNRPSRKFEGWYGVDTGDPREEPMPRYWVASDEIESVLGGWNRQWLLVFRDIARSNDERTFISALIPRAAVGNKAPLMLTRANGRYNVGGLLANLNSVLLDYLVRQKIGGAAMNFFIVKQLPVIPPAPYDMTMGEGERVTEWITRRVLELSYTSWSLQPLARDLGYNGPPFNWDDERRAHLRGELDGMYAHLYGLSRNDFEYILTTFPVLKKNEERKYGEYRTARLALAAYDALAPLMAEANR